MLLESINAILKLNTMSQPRIIGTAVKQDYETAQLHENYIICDKLSNR
jgi:hypothetical protein